MSSYCMILTRTTNALSTRLMARSASLRKEFVPPFSPLTNTAVSLMLVAEVKDGDVYGKRLGES